jgi:hypothetical protein
MLPNFRLEVADIECFLDVAFLCFFYACHIIIHQSSLQFILVSLRGSLFLAVNVLLEGLLPFLEFVYRIMLLCGESHTFAIQRFLRRVFPRGQPVAISPSIHLYT